MCPAASQDGMSLGARVRCRGGWGQIPTSPSFSPVFWVSGGGGFMQFWLCGAPLSAWLGCIRPQSCVVRGAGIQKSVFLHPFPQVLLVFFPLASDLLMFKKIINKKLFMWSRYGARAGGRGAWSSRGRGWAGCGVHTGDWRVVGVAMWMGGLGGVACFAVGRCVGVV